MAVDTRQKRFSMMNFSTVPTIPLFEADGTVDLDDQVHMLNLYSGLALGLPPSGIIYTDTVYMMQSSAANVYILSNETSTVTE